MAVKYFIRQVVFSGIRDTSKENECCQLLLQGQPHRIAASTWESGAMQI
jgi:hypothetical protein